MKTIRVLLIEDNPGDARLVREMLMQLDDIGFDITTRETLTEGAAWLDEHDPNVVLLDLGLPDSQGIGTFKAVQEQAPLIPIVVLTGLKDDELAVEMAGEGAQEYLVKEDINSDVLRHAVQYAIQRKSIERRMARVNSLLRAIRDINQLIVRETDPEKIVTDACTFLARVSGYHHVRVFLTDETGEAHIGVCAGPDGTETCPERDLPLCMKQAIADGETLFLESEGDLCSECTWRDAYDEAYHVITVPLSYIGNMYGALSVFIPAERQTIGGEENLFQEVADDLAFALYDMELEEKHRQAEEKYRLLAENAIDVIWKMDLDMQFTYLSSSLQDMTGYSPEEWIGTKPTDHAPTGEAQKMQQVVAEYLERWPEQDHARFESAIICRDGSIIPVEITGKAIVDEQGEPVGLQGTTRDITERKQAQQQLEEREKKYREIFDNANDAMYLHTLTDDGMPGAFIEVNDVACEMLGYTHEEFMEMSPMDIDDPDAPTDVPAVMQDLLDEGHATFEMRHVAKNGSHVPVEISSHTFTLNGQRLVLSIARDITERKQAQQELEKRELKLRTLFEETPNPILVANEKEEYVDANQAALDFLECDMETLKGMNVFEWAPPSRREQQIKEHTPFDEPRTLETDYYVNGRVKTLLLNVVPLTIEGETLLYGIGQDITERKKTQEKLEKSERKFRNLFETMAEGVVYQDADGNITSANPAAERILGLSLEQMQGKTSMDPRWKAIDENGNELPGEKHPAMVALKTGEKVENFVQGIFVPERNEYVWMLVNSIPQFKKGSNEPYQVYSTFRDITQRKKAEDSLKESEKELREAQRLANIGNWRWNLETRDLYLSDEMYNIIGLEKNEEALDVANHEPYYTPETWEIFQEAVEKAQTAKESYEIELEVIRENKKNRKVVARGEPLLDEDGTVTGLRGTLQDITERKEIREELQKSERKYRELFNTALVGISVHNAQGDIIAANDAAEEIFGHSEEELREKDLDFWIGKLIRPDGKPMEPSEFPLSVVAETKAPSEGKVVGLSMSEDADTMWFIHSARPIINEGGDVEKVVTSFVDITERKRYERQLRETKNRYQSLFDNSLVGIGLATPDGDIVEANDAFTDILGYKKSELKQMNATDLYRNPSEREKIQKTLKKNGVVKDHETVLHHKDGANVHVLLSISKIDIEGTSLYQTTCLDITERKQVQHELEESEEKYRAIVEGSHDAIFIYRGDEFLFVNDRAAELTSYREEALMDMPIWNLIHPDDLDLVKDVHRQWVQDKEPPNVYQARIVTRDGDVRHCEFSMTAIAYQGREAAMGAVRDITRQKMAEEERERYIDELRFISETILSVSRMQDTDEICQRIAEKVHEVNEDAVVGVSLYDPAREVITIPAMEGLGDMADRAFKLFAGDPTEHTITPEEMSEDVTALLNTGKLKRLPGGLYDAIGGTLPRSACKAAEKFFGIGATYAVGFSIGDMPGGGISIFVPKEQELRYPSAIETVASHVSRVLQQRQAEEEREKAMAEMERALELEKHFKADAAHFFLNPIAIAKGYMEIAMEEMPDKPEEKISRAQRAIKRVENVIQNIVTKGEIHE
jgi:PAS domain S-box-containing protein